MSTVLLLNASWEALRAIPMKRAVCLVLQDKAEIVESNGTSIRSVSISIPKPEVIRLKYYVKVPPRKRVPLSNKAILLRDNYRCGYCGLHATTIDHILPKSKGGNHTWENCISACSKCNTKKGSKILSELGWTLNKQPEPPSMKAWIFTQYPGRWTNYFT